MNILSELVLLFFALSSFFAAYFFYKKYAAQVEETKTIIAKFTQKRTEELLVDLELATSDQLFNELKNRPMMPFLLVRPQEQGVTVVSHNILPVLTAQMLTFAAFIVQKQLTSQGIDFDGPRFMDDNE